LNPSEGNNSVNIIVSGIGCYPVRKKGHLLPQQEDPTLCEDAVTTILNALKARPALVKPGLVVLSTTGISKYGRDVPLLIMPLYSLMGEAHDDKRAMEALVTEAVSWKPAPIGISFVVRASLLTSGSAKGMQNIKWDIEEEGKLARKGFGYTISRADVGGFVFEKIVKPFESGKDEGTYKIYSISH
jgi:hypothetical protein